MLKQDQNLDLAFMLPLSLQSPQTELISTLLYIQLGTSFEVVSLQASRLWLIVLLTEIGSWMTYNLDTELTLLSTKPAFLYWANVSLPHGWAQTCCTALTLPLTPQSYSCSSLHRAKLALNFTELTLPLTPQSYSCSSLHRANHGLNSTGLVNLALNSTELNLPFTLQS